MLHPCIWSSYLVEFPIEQAVKEFLECGFQRSELSDEHAESLLTRGNPEKTGRALKQYADELGFHFPQGHLKLRANICSDDANHVIEELKHWLDLFQSVGIQSAVLHSGDAPGLTDQELLEKRVAGLTTLTDHIKGTSMTICLENLFRTTKSCDSLLEIIHAVGSKQLGICLDTGHLHLSQASSQSDFIKKAGAHLKALHIADNEGQTDQHLMPYGRGTVDWADVLRGLHEIGYQGVFNFEIPGERKAPLEMLKNKLIYVKQMTTYMSGEMNRVSI